MVRFKNRYLLTELSWSRGQVDDLSAHDLVQEIRKSVVTNFGDYGAGSTKQSLTVKYFNNVTNIAIIRAPRVFFRELWASLTFMTKIQNKHVTLRVLHVGGSVRSCQKHALAYDLALMQSYHDERRLESDKQRVMALMEEAEAKLLGMSGQ
eukprot:gnl/Hemi2/13111_TR4481_c0_g1_i1.p1 gnl/Hemi2/13111_TR4481_c0_g1~~gnl/Hemi2/13111_TR4481_c0_g1_i1.p1  ORF type:complete len:151 (-),score=11.81 gnl/Hemi2/13111_TR4481_c0_g1_i1:63-515(-)